MPAQISVVQQPPITQHGNPGFQNHGGHMGSTSSGGGGKGPTANNFPGPGNRAYFTKEYMEILKGIKSNKAIEEAKKKIGASKYEGARRSTSGSRVVELPDEGSQADIRSHEKNGSGDDMKVWVTTTLSDSLKLINGKLDGVDKKSKLDAAERDELERLHREVQGGQANKERSSNEKRKRCVARTPVENSSSAAGVNPRSRGSSNTKPKRIEQSDDKGPSGAKQNLQPKMESMSSELSDIKRMLAALMSGLPDPKGKAKVVEPGSAKEGRKGKAVGQERRGPAVADNPEEDVDIVQKAQVDGEEDPDEDGFAAYMKIQAEYYSSLHYTRVQDMCKERDVEYFKKDVAVWELARQDLEEYADSLKGDQGTGERGRSRRKEAPVDKNHDDSEGDCDAVKGN
ncbi:hypothetical protein CBR_g49834 [Chara braunii]|uniref:Uncharacterized protein n=1 Tax=Chara braunii TaxID=69332 RepID=A0A388JP57_CHABU|nr:hypothetical protein CBR_g49834 [Chara braunii]|eukprot:GBG59574.1 hypothetical protein CBR_g49834 [Chara braunii]